MSTEVGNVIKNYGQKHYTTVTNLNGDIILSKKMNPHSLIVSAPTSVSKQDIGTYSLFASDYNGNAVRLTYTIQPGNGLIIGRDGYNATSSDDMDVLSMSIDNWSITTYEDGAENPGMLYVNKTNIIDNKTLMVVTPEGDTERIKVITANLDKSTPISYGISKGDEDTIITNNGTLSVFTAHLDAVDDAHLVDGIVCHNEDPLRTIDANAGVLNVITKNLEPANHWEAGVVKPDNSYTFVDEEGFLTVGNFRYAYNEVVSDQMYDEDGNELTDEDGNPTFTRVQVPIHGIIAPDLITTYVKTEDGINNGMLGVLTAGLDHAIEANPGCDTKTTDEEIGGRHGIVRPDGWSTGITSNGLLEVKNYGAIRSVIDNYESQYTYLIDKVLALEARIVELETAATPESISLGIDTMMDELDEPVWNGKTVVSQIKNITVQIQVSTNCMYYASVEYKNNLAPGIRLQSVKRNNVVVTGSSLAEYKFASTDETIEQMEFTFKCINFNSTTSDELFKNTRIIIKLTSVNDESVYKKATFSVKRYNEAMYVQPTVANPLVYPIRGSQPSLYMGITEMRWLNNAGNETTLNSDVLPGKTNSVVRNLILKGQYQTGLAPNVTLTTKNITPKFTSTGFPIDGTMFSNPAYYGYLTYNIDYTYKYSVVENNNVVLKTAKSTDEWLSMTLDASPAKTIYGESRIRFTSKSGMPSDIVSRTANVTLSAYDPSVYGVSPKMTYTFKYTEVLHEAEPSVVVTASMSNVKPYVTLTAQRPIKPVPNDSVSQKWGGVVYMKYINKNGYFINPNSGLVDNSSYIYTSITGTKLDLGKTSGVAYTNTGEEVDIFNTRPTLNSVAGLKVVDFKTSSFANTPKTTLYTRNRWNILAEKKNVSYTFGDAKITNITIKPWDYFNMIISFNIIPGKYTNIPTGAKIEEILTTNNGKRAFNFIVNGRTLSFANLYDNVVFNAGNWNSLTGTTVTFKMTYSNRRINPLDRTVLDEIQYVKFWFALTASYNDTYVKTTFEVSNTGLSDRIGSAIVDKTIGFAQNLNIVNALYNPISTTANKTAETKVDYSQKTYEQVAELTRLIRENVTAYEIYTKAGLDRVIAYV